MAAEPSQAMCMKYLLVHLMLLKPEDIFTLYSIEEDGDYLSGLWAQAGNLVPDSQRLGGMGLSAWYRPAGENDEAVVLSLPAPQSRSEAWFVALFRTPDRGARIFALEKGAESGTEQPSAVLAEIRPDGRANWGPLGEHRLEYFVENVDAIIHDPEATPMAFTAIPMI